MKFQGLCLITGDVARLAHFYRELFETTSEGNDTHTTMSIGGLGLAIWRPGPAGGTADALPRRHCFSLIFKAEDVDATYRRALALGATSHEEPADQPWGCRACVISDPDGNRIDIVDK